MGRFFEAPVRPNGELAWQDRVTLSLTFDHRVVDGVPAAQFLQSLCGTLASLGTQED